MSRISCKNLENLSEKEKDKDDSINSLTLEQLFENDDLLKSMTSSNNYQKFSQQYEIKIIIKILYFIALIMQK